MQERIQTGEDTGRRGCRRGYMHVKIQGEDKGRIDTDREKIQAEEDTGRRGYRQKRVQVEEDAGEDICRKRYREKIKTE